MGPRSIFFSDLIDEIMTRMSRLEFYFRTYSNSEHLMAIGMVTRPHENAEQREFSE
jgi:hypothetical protein